MVISLSKTVLNRVLHFASLYGPSSSEPAAHSHIGAVNMHIIKGKIQTYTCTHPVMSSVVHMSIKDKDGIKGKGTICIGEICKIIGGRDQFGNSWKSVFDRLDDPVTLTVNRDQLILNKDKRFELSISLLKTNLISRNNLERKKFQSRLGQDDLGNMTKDGKPLGSRISIAGDDFVSMVGDEKKMASEYFEFIVDDESQEELIMALGNTSRSSKTKIPILDVDLSEGDINGKFFNGLEAFSKAIDRKHQVDIYYNPSKNVFTFIQIVEDVHILFLEGGAKEDD